MSEEIPLIPSSISHYVFRGTLGEGATSIVKLAFNSNEHNYYACKIVSKSQQLNTEERRSKFEAEIRIMQELHHPGVVELYELLQDESYYYIFMEFCANGELFEYIVNHRRLTENESKNFLRQLILAIQYIHSAGIAHRDLKPENLLLDTFHHIKITDFGLSKKIADNLCRTPCGSPVYASPETLSGSSYDPYKADVWSIGVILYVMATGMVPWSQRNSTQMFAQIRSGEYQTPNFLSDDCRDLIRKMMCVEPEKRISLEEALGHRWMKNAEKTLTASRDKQCAVSLKMIDEFFQKEQQENGEDIIYGDDRDIENDDRIENNCNINENQTSNENENNRNGSNNSVKEPEETGARRRSPRMAKAGLRRNLCTMSQKCTANYIDNSIIGANHNLVGVGNDLKAAGIISGHVAQPPDRKIPAKQHRFIPTPPRRSIGAVKITQPFQTSIRKIKKI